jgi:LCP family protein required for cell wall assembly
MRNPFKKKDPLALERKDGLFRGVAVRGRKRSRFGFLRRKWVAIPLAIFIVLGAVGGYFAYRYFHTQGKVQVKVPGVTPEAKASPFNALLVGSDSRDGLTDEEQLKLGAADTNPDGTPLGGDLADTIILAHVDPATQRVTMVQFPRDLYVKINGGKSSKINSALQQGRSALVQTMSDLTGLQINHFAQVNLAGFRDVVDAIGGVDVCVPEPIPFDPATGIEVTPEEVGMVHFSGERALRFVRSRKIFPNGDFDRIANQQKFLAAAIQQLTSPTTLLKVSTLNHLLDIAGKNVRIDSHTTMIGLYKLSSRFKQFDPEHYEAYTAPNLGTGENEAGSVVLPDYASMKVLFKAMADNESPSEADGVPNVDPSSVRVGVYNGAGIANLAHKSAVALQAATTIGTKSIEIVEEANAPRPNFKSTVVRYDPKETGSKLKAQFIAAALPGAEVEEGDTLSGVDVAVIVGKAKFRTKRLIELVPLKIPAPGELPAVCRD